MIIHPAHPLATFAALDAELSREHTARSRAYPDRVATAKMAPAEAQAGLAVVLAWQEDARRLLDFRTRTAALWSAGNLALWAQARMAPASHTVDWRTRRHALDRELRARERTYPERVATAQMTQATADLRLACLHALARIYDQGFDWPHERPAADPAFWRYQLGLNPHCETATMMLATMEQAA